MQSIRARAFSGPTQHLALAHPFFGDKPVLQYGVPIGINMLTRELVYFDPWYLKDIGAIHSTQGLFIGDKGRGKSASLKIILLRLSMLSAGYEAMRVSINDHKVEGDRMEYSAISDLIGAEMFSMAGMRINPFDERLSPLLSNQIDMAETMCSFVTDSELSPAAATSLRVAVYGMYRGSHHLWGFATLLDKLRTMNLEDVDTYLQETRSSLRKELHAKLEVLSNRGVNVEAEADQLEAQFSQEMTLDRQRILDNANHVHDLIDNLVSGKDGSLFGSNTGLYEMYTRRANAKDWSGLTTRGETIMRTLDARIKAYAIENKNHSLIPHLEADDERHRSIANMANLRASAYFSKVGRAVHCCNISATHRLGDLRRGGVDSEAYNLGDGIVKDMGFTWIGRQKNSKADITELQDLHRLSTLQRDWLPQLPPYCFLVKLGEEFEPTFVRVFATEPELAVIKTDSATERMLRRPNILRHADLKEYAMANGVQYLGLAA